ncbi:hypothetical protein, partial [Enterococcus faecalis]
TDVTNAILAEMLKNQNRIIEMMAAFQTTFAKLHYSGEANEAAKTSTKKEFQEKLGEYLEIKPAEITKKEVDRFKKLAGDK